MASTAVIIRNFKMATIIFMFTNISGVFFLCWMEEFVKNSLRTLSLFKRAGEVITFRALVIKFDKCTRHSHCPGQNPGAVHVKIWNSIDKKLH